MKRHKHKVSGLNLLLVLPVFYETSPQYLTNRVDGVQYTLENLIFGSKTNTQKLLMDVGGLIPLLRVQMRLKWQVYGVFQS